MFSALSPSPRENFFSFVLTSFCKNCRSSSRLTRRPLFWRPFFFPKRSFLPLFAYRLVLPSTQTAVFPGGAADADPFRSQAFLPFLAAPVRLPSYSLFGEETGRIIEVKIASRSRLFLFSFSHGPPLPCRPAWSYKRFTPAEGACPFHAHRDPPLFPTPFHGERLLLFSFSKLNKRSEESLSSHAVVCSPLNSMPFLLHSKIRLSFFSFFPSTAILVSPTPHKEHPPLPIFAKSDKTLFFFFCTCFPFSFFSLRVAGRAEVSLFPLSPSAYPPLPL